MGARITYVVSYPSKLKSFEPPKADHLSREENPYRTRQDWPDTLAFTNHDAIAAVVGDGEIFRLTRPPTEVLRQSRIAEFQDDLGAGAAIYPS